MRGSIRQMRFSFVQFETAFHKMSQMERFRRATLTPIYTIDYISIDFHHFYPYTPSRRVQKPLQYGKS
jgi:hypothetical protein